MKIIDNIAKTKPTRIIATCTKDEAFRLGSDWYTRIEINDYNLRYCNKDFVDDHIIFGHEGASWVALVPCVHISSMSFVYIDGTRAAEEWATLTATLTTP